MINLPKDFDITAKQSGNDEDKVWLFANYGNGNVFHGLVDELLIYSRALTAEELERVPLKP